MELPVAVRKYFGHALHFAQMGEQHSAAKVLKGFGGSAVIELIEGDSAGTYRAVYTVRFEEAVFVLHCVQKKSKTGIATPKREIEIIRTRLKMAEVVAIGTPFTGSKFLTALQLVAQGGEDLVDPELAAAADALLSACAGTGQAELAAERDRLEKERHHYINALEVLRANGDESAVEELANRLADIDKAIAANDFHILVIPSLAFGFIHAKQLVLSFQNAAPDAQIQTPITQNIKHGILLRNPHRVIQWQ